MKIQLNGDRVSIDPNLTVGDLFRAKNLDPATVVVEHNRQIVVTEALDQTRLEEGDTLEILRFVGGG